MSRRPSSKKGACVVLVLQCQHAWQLACYKRHMRAGRPRSVTVLCASLWHPVTAFAHAPTSPLAVPPHASPAVIDLDTWTVTRPATTGDTPSPRFGCSLLVYDNKLWVVGGGFGYDLARSGYDHSDIHVLDLATWEWSRVETTNQPHSNRWACVGAGN